MFGIGCGGDGRGSWKQKVHDVVVAVPLRVGPQRQISTDPVGLLRSYRIESPPPKHRTVHGKCVFATVRQHAHQHQHHRQSDVSCLFVSEDERNKSGVIVCKAFGRMGNGSHGVRENLVHSTYILYFLLFSVFTSTAFVAEARQIVAEETNAKITGKASLDVVLFA